MGTFGGSIFGGGGSGGSGPAGTVPASKLFYAAMRKAGITLAPGRTPSLDQFQDALDECNRMIGGWNCERPKIYTVRIDELALTTAKEYTIGIDPAGQSIADFNVPRPQEIIKANILFPTTPVVRREMQIFEDDEWAAIVLQDIPSGVPLALFNDGAYPFSTISIWPQATAGYILELYTWESLPKFATTSDAVTLPDGYEDCIVLNLACRLFSHFQKGEPSPRLQRDAARALAAIAAKNTPPSPKISADAPGKGRRGFSYLTGF